jgi:hypothetical protein
MDQHTFCPVVTVASDDCPGATVMAIQHTVMALQHTFCTVVTVPSGDCPGATVMAFLHTVMALQHTVMVSLGNLA